ncbi:MAG TPA: 4-(cytidine 5'-diphospho)-2-C-methyl-D-erythritol kinase [Acidimicrobiia bacterium]|jgi:4-diphosphocytidyl-2-C-methyl-D-erythritol kinase
MSLGYFGEGGDSGSRSLRVLARAKLTLSLRVLGRRPDGYHDLEALVVSVEEPHDVLSVCLRPTAGVFLWPMSGRAAGGVPAGADNLAAVAGRRILQASDDAEPFAAAGLEILLHKEIPAGAGLGGGSADAAATLVAGDRLLDLALDPAALTDLAAELGSDVAFCLAGGIAWMRGRGEVIEPLAPVGQLPLVVAAPSFALATPAVYAAWDDLGGPRSARTVPAPPALAGLLPGGLANDLEPAAEAVEPRLRPFREALEDLAQAPALLAGSGSAQAVIVADPERAKTLAREVKARLGARAWATRPAEAGVAW